MAIENGTRTSSDAERILHRVGSELDQLDAYLDARVTSYGWQRPNEMLDYIASRLDDIRKLIGG